MASRIDNVNNTLSTDITHFHAIYVLPNGALVAAYHVAVVMRESTDTAGNVVAIVLVTDLNRHLSMIVPNKRSCSVGDT